MSTLSIDQFRSRFPIFKSRVYVNSCSQGALSTDVEAATHEYLATWHEHGSPWELWVEQVEALRTAFARSIGADRDEIAVVPSASAGINAIASALDFSGPRSTVVMGEFEFPTMAQVWLAQERRGAAVRWANAHGERLEVDAYADVIDERTLIVPMTHVCYKNGHKTDVARVARLARDRGAYSLLDDYQRTGSGPIDVHALGVDFMVTGCLKYILAAAGVAFLFVRRDIVERFEPTMTGWFGRVNPFAFQTHSLDWPPAARRFESGTPPVPSAYAALASLRLLESVGMETVGRRVAQLVERYRTAAEACGFVVRTPPEPERRGPLVVVQSVDAPALVARLAGRGIIGSCRANGLRISFHAYNNDADVDHVIDALRAEAALLARAEAKSV